MKVIVIFTYGISLKHWVDSGIYDREMLLYQSLEEEYRTDRMVLGSNNNIQSLQAVRSLLKKDKE